MSWNILKKAITDVIKTNGNEEITGQNLQNTLVSMVNVLGDNSTFAGFALPTTNPGNPDGPVFYLANVAGVYSNFSGYEVKEGEAVVLNWDGSGNWSKHTLTTGAGGSNSVKDLGNIDDFTAFAYLANPDNLVTKNDDGSYNFNKPILYTWNSGLTSNLVISISASRIITQLHFGYIGEVKVRFIVWSPSSDRVENITDWNDYAVNSSRAGFMTPSMLQILEGASGVMGGNAQVIEWSHTRNMNDYKNAGAYRIKGERTGNPLEDNLPIMNQGSGHTIEGILYVLDSSLTNGSGKEDDCTITQFLMLSNRVGGQEGDMYMRSGYGLHTSDDSFTWKPWEKFQTNIEVSVVSDDATHDPSNFAPINANGLNSLVDNGIYSGVYLTEEALSGDSTKAQTFVMVVINNYAAAGDYKTFTQIKFAVTNAGEYSMERRSCGFDGKWSGWINEYNDLSTRMDEAERRIQEHTTQIGLMQEEVNEVEKTVELLANYSEDDFSYGVEWDVTISSPACSRIGNINLHRKLPVQSKMRGCLLDDDGNVVEYLDSNDWNNNVLDGSKGQVMVEIPAHYRKFVTNGTKRQVWLSEMPLNGFHEVPKTYISAYQAALQRSTNKLASVVNITADYRGGNNNANYDNASNSLLGKAVTGLSRTNFRAYARNRNTSNKNWNCMTYDAQKTLYWLFVVEYATLNSQASYTAELTSEGLKQGGLGVGVTTLNGDKWNSFNGHNPCIPCGITDTLGNNTGVVKYEMPEEYDSSIVTINVPRYRGIEQPFGHIWQWTDGINIRISPNIEDGGDGLSKVFVCSNPEYFSDVSYDGYNYVGNESRVNGYIKEAIFGDNGEIIPSVCTGSSTTYHCDYRYTDIPTTEALRGVLFGGSAFNGPDAGFACSRSTNSPATTHANFGSRLIYIPN